MASLIAGAKYRGEFEDRIKRFLQEVMAEGNILLFNPTNWNLLICVISVILFINTAKHCIAVTAKFNNGD